MNKKLLRKKLALMLTNLKKKRPYFCEVEYLESTGTQYIDTGINVNNKCKIRAIAKFNNITTTQFSGTWGPAGRFQFGVASGKFNLGLGSFGLEFGSADTNRHVFEIDAKNKTCTIDDEIKSYSDTTMVFENNPYIAIFAQHNIEEDIVLNGAKANVYSFKIWDDDILVRDFIPVLDLNMRPAMYDKVSGELFYNQRTGADFTVGREIHPVEYLESNGVEQRISTGVTIDLLPITIDTVISTSATYNSTYQLIVGTTTGTQCLVGFTSGDPKFAIKYNNNTYVTSVAPDADKKYEVSAVITSTSSALTVDGIEYTNVSNYTANGEEIGLFAQRYNTSSNRMYSCKIYKGEVLVRDYIPAIDENGVGFMFDRVTHAIFDNLGTGTFIAGKIVESEYE